LVVLRLLVRLRRRRLMLRKMRRRQCMLLWLLGVSRLERVLEGAA